MQYVADSIIFNTVQWNLLSGVYQMNNISGSWMLLFMFLFLIKTFFYFFNGCHFVMLYPNSSLTPPRSVYLASFYRATTVRWQSLSINCSKDSIKLPIFSGYFAYESRGGEVTSKNTTNSLQELGLGQPAKKLFGSVVRKKTGSHLTFIF